MPNNNQGMFPAASDIESAEFAREFGIRTDNLKLIRVVFVQE